MTRVHCTPGPTTAEVVLRAHAIIQDAGLDPATCKPETWYTAACQAQNELWVEEVQALAEEVGRSI